MPDTPDFSVSADWLERRLGEPGLRIVDASWYLPAMDRDQRAEYAAAHIPGAVFFDQDAVVEPGVDLPHALPSATVFARHAGAMGIAETDTIVVYDGPGLFSAPRVWWLFRAMGAAETYLLEGGLDGWRADGRPLTDAPGSAKPQTFAARFDTASVAGLDDMRRAVEVGDTQIIDARPAGRFTGAEPEPRPGMRSGHMPGAFNVPALELSRDGSLLDGPELRSRFKAAGVDLSRPVITSCGSGVTAATLILALRALGHSDHRLYDGSWSEWGGRADTPVVTGR